MHCQPPQPNLDIDIEKDLLHEHKRQHNAFDPSVQI
jgi:hypothetical protein